MKKIGILAIVLILNACSTKYILIDEDENPVEKGYYTENILEFNEQNGYVDENVSATDTAFYEAEYPTAERPISADDVFVVGEGADYVTYQYKNVRVDEISPLASMYCADIAYGASPYLREVNMYHNGFMRATFDCVSLAI